MNYNNRSNYNNMPPNQYNYGHNRTYSANENTRSGYNQQIQGNQGNFSAQQQNYDYNQNYNSGYHQQFQQSRQPSYLNQQQNFVPNCGYGNVNTVPLAGNSTAFVPNNSQESIEKQKKIAVRKELRKTSNRISGGMLIFIIATSMLFSVFLIPVEFIIGINTGTPLGIDAVTLYIINAIVSLICEFIAAVFIIKLNSCRIDEVIKIKKTNIADTIKYVFAGMGFVFVFNLLLSIMNSNLNMFGFENDMSDYGEISGVAGSIIYFIAIAVVPPIIEEFIFRGAILGSLRKYGDGIAIIVSAVMFGFAHSNFIQTPVTFLTGLVLGYLTVKTGSIIPAMLLHFVNNATAVLGEKLMEFISDERLYGIVDSAIAIIFLAVGLICTIMLIKKHGNKIFELDNSVQIKKTELTMSKRLVYIFTAPWTIVYTILTILLCIEAYMAL